MAIQQVWLWHYMDSEQMGDELAAVRGAQEGGQHGRPDHEGLHPLNGGVIKVKQSQRASGSVTPLHICSFACSKVFKHAQSYEHTTKLPSRQVAHEPETYTAYSG